MLVLTKSVLANPHLDSKVRVAQVLSKEGLSITKNLLAELAFLSIGSFTLMPFFQECCKIAAVCFLSDFFIQLTLFTPFYSLLVQRIKVIIFIVWCLTKFFDLTKINRNEISTHILKNIHKMFILVTFMRDLENQFSKKLPNDCVSFCS